MNASIQRETVNYVQGFYVTLRVLSIVVLYKMNNPVAEYSFENVRA